MAGWVGACQACSLPRRWEVIGVCQSKIEKKQTTTKATNGRLGQISGWQLGTACVNKKKDGDKAIGGVDRSTILLEQDEGRAILFFCCGRVGCLPWLGQPEQNHLMSSHTCASAG